MSESTSGTGRREFLGNPSGGERHMRVHPALMAIDGAAVDPALTPSRPPDRPRSRDSRDEGEADVLRRAADGDGAATRRIFDAHVAAVHRHVARILGANDGDVEDVVQQVFLAALEGATRFDARSSVRTWLLGIATRRALDQARGRWRRARWGNVLEWVGLGAAPAAPDRAIERNTAEAMLAALPPGPRAVFVLHEVEGYTLQEISILTGVGISTLHARLKSARKRLDDAIARAAREEMQR